MMFFILTFFLERIDLSMGYSPIRITPLIISIVFFQIFFLKDIMKKIEKINIYHCVFVLFLFFIITISTIINIKIVSAGKSITIITNLIFAYEIYLLCSKKVFDIVEKTLKIYLLLCIPLLTYNYVDFYFGLDYNFRIIDLQTMRLWLYTPRFSGFELDPNRGGFEFALMYIFFSYVRKNNAFAIVSMMMMILSVSRSACFSMLMFYITKFLIEIDFSIKLKKTFVIIVGIFLFICFLENNDILKAIVLSRIDFNEYSASIHFELYKEAIRYISSDGIHFLFGYGFGSSGVLLKNYFDGGYGNFHSGYLSILVEGGSLFFLTSLIFVSKYLIFNKNLILIMLLSFSIFYQYFHPFAYLIIFIWNKFLMEKKYENSNGCGFVSTRYLWCR